MKRPRHGLTRTVIVCLALVIALAATGVGYAQQNGGGQNNGVVVLLNQSGFTWAVSNDDGTEDSVSSYGTIDPGDDGGGTLYDRWGTDSSNDPSAPQQMGVPCPRYPKDVARTAAHMDGEGREITVLVENAYPSYYPTVFFGIRGPDSFSTAIMSIVIENPHPDVLTVTTSGISVGQPIPAGEEIVGAVHAHVEQAAQQNATYAFRIIITFGQSPGISLTKQASPTSVTQAGTPVTYTYTVTNAGNVPLDNVTVTENAGDFTGSGPLPVPVYVDGSSTQDSPEGTLKPGESATYTAQYIVTEADIQAGSIFNRATATGYFEGTPYSANDEAIVTASTPNNPSCPAGGCVRLLTVDWDGEITTTCLDPSDRCLEDLYAPSPSGRHSLFLETWTRAPEVEGTRHYLITIRELDECPPSPENMVCVGAFHMSPPGALFDRDIFLTLGIDALPDDAVDATIAYYDDVNGVWVPLYSEPGEPDGVAEITLTAALDHFSIFGLLVDVDPAARLVASNLDITADVEKIWDPVAFLTRTGRDATIGATVTNRGRWAGTFTVVLKLDGEEIESEMISLGGGQSREVTFTVTGMEYGLHEVEVAGLRGEFETSWSLRWWLIAAILAAIGLIIWGAARDRKKRRARKEA